MLGIPSFQACQRGFVLSQSLNKKLKTMHVRGNSGAINLVVGECPQCMLDVNNKNNQLGRGELYTMRDKLTCDENV